MRVFRYALVTAVIAAPAVAQSPPGAAKSLQFADIGSISKWQAGGDRVVYVVASRQWYKVTMLQPCMKFYPNQPLNFITETDTVTHEQRSAVDVAHHQCLVTEIVKIDRPPPEPTPLVSAH